LLVQMTSSLMSTKHVLPALKAGVYMLPVPPPKSNLPLRRNANGREAQPAVLIIHHLCFQMVAQCFLRRCLGSDLSCCSSWLRSQPPNVEAASWSPNGMSHTHGTVFFGFNASLRIPPTRTVIDDLLVNLSGPSVYSGLLPQPFDDILEAADITAEH
jgi:hypothetical protein